MKFNGAILSIVALLLANAGGELIYSQGRPSKGKKGNRGAYGFMGMPSGKNEDVATSRQRLRPAGSYVPSYLLDRTALNKVEPQVVQSLSPTDEQLEAAGEELERTTASVSEEEEGLPEAASPSRKRGGGPSEFSSPSDDGEGEAEEAAEEAAEAEEAEEAAEEAAEAEEAEENQFQSPPQEASISPLYNATDAMLMGSAPQAPNSDGEGEPAVEAEVAGYSYHGTVEQGSDYATPQVREQLKVIPPTRIRLGGTSGRTGQRRGRRKNKPIPASQRPQIPQQGRSRKGRGKKNVIFKGNLGDFWKWEDNRQNMQ